MAALKSIDKRVQVESGTTRGGRADRWSETPAYTQSSVYIASHRTAYTYRSLKHVQTYPLKNENKINVSN